jgi:thymidine phosphorylase
MNAIIDAQGRRDDVEFKPGPISFEVTADSDGVVTAIDNFLLARMARIAGAPLDKAAGVDLLKKLGDPVHKGETLYRVHAEFQSDFKFARALHEERGSGYRIGEPDQVPKLYVEF